MTGDRYLAETARKAARRDPAAVAWVLRDAQAVTLARALNSGELPRAAMFFGVARSPRARAAVVDLRPPGSSR